MLEEKGEVMMMNPEQLEEYLQDQNRLANDTKMIRKMEKNTFFKKFVRDYNKNLENSVKEGYTYVPPVKVNQKRLNKRVNNGSIES